MKPTIETAIKTLMSMCLDVLSDGITIETFIMNLRNYAEYIEQELNK